MVSREVTREIMGTVKEGGFVFFYLLVLSSPHTPRRSDTSKHSVSQLLLTNLGACSQLAWRVLVKLTNILMSSQHHLDTWGQICNSSQLKAVQAPASIIQTE